MSKGGMQTAAIDVLYCKCGKPTSRIIFVNDKEISIHFTKKSSYWHIVMDGKIKRTFSKPLGWE